MNPTNFIRIFMLLAIGVAYSATGRAGQAASTWQDRAAIRSTAESYLHSLIQGKHQGQRTEVRLGQLDPRLRLKACRGALEGFTPSGSRSLGNTTIGVRCTDAGSWSLYVPARIDVFAPVLVARQPLMRGAVARVADFEPVERNLASLPYGYYTDPHDIAGMVVKRTITAATVVTPQMLQAPKLVRRGEHVVIIAETGNLSIRSSGKALGDGKSGDLVRIETSGSRRIIDGIVVSQGVVKVTL